MASAMLTEIGLGPNNEVVFLNYPGEFVLLNDEYVSSLLVYTHDENFVLSNISLVNPDECLEIANYDKLAIQKAQSKNRVLSFAAMAADFKLGTLLTVPEFFVALWQQIKPLIFKEASTA